MFEANFIVALFTITLKVVELKKELAERGLIMTGNKSDLVARLEEYMLKRGT